MYNYEYATLGAQYTPMCAMYLMVYSSISHSGVSLMIYIYVRNLSTRRPGAHKAASIRIPMCMAVGLTVKQRCTVESIGRVKLYIH